jgi:hypothetical protein
MVNHPNRSKAKFYEGQEIKVGGHKAKIIKWPRREADRWRVQFEDGTSSIFDEERIKIYTPDYDPDGINQAVRNQLENQK